MKKYTYKIVPIIYSSKMTMKIDLDKNEQLLNDLGAEGWKITTIQKAMHLGYFYLEKELNEMEEAIERKFKYKISQMVPTSIMNQSPSINENEGYLTGEGLIGWKLIQVFNPNTSNSGYQYYFLEKTV